MCCGVVFAGVDISTVVGFNRMRQLTTADGLVEGKDWLSCTEFVALSLLVFGAVRRNTKALQKSTTLKLSEDDRKVRRTDLGVPPRFPKIEDADDKIVYFENLHPDSTTDTLREMIRDKAGVEVRLRSRRLHVPVLRFAYTHFFPWCEQVLLAHVPRFRDGGKLSKGFAFVEAEDEKQIQRILKYCGGIDSYDERVGEVRCFAKKDYDRYRQTGRLRYPEGCVVEFKGVTGRCERDDIESALRKYDIEPKRADFRKGDEVGQLRMTSPDSAKKAIKEMYELAECWLFR